MQTPNPVLGVATVTGMLMAGQALLSMVAAPLAGVVSDRTDRRWSVVAWGLIIGALGLTLLALEAPVAILLGLCAAALSRGGLQSLATRLTGDLVEPAQRGRAIGLLHTAGDLGSAVGPPLAYLLLPSVGLQRVYLLCAGLFLVSLVLVFSFSTLDSSRKRNFRSLRLVKWCKISRAFP